MNRRKRYCSGADREVKYERKVCPGLSHARARHFELRGYSQGGRLSPATQNHSHFANECMGGVGKVMEVRPLSFDGLLRPI